MTEQKKKINGWRIFFAFIYFVLPIIVAWLLSDKLFYLTEKKDIESLYRLLWCYLCSMWGFALIAFYWRHVTVSPFPEYLTHYPVMLLVIASLVFSITHLFDRTTGYLFYYVTFAPCFILSFLVDEFWTIIRSILPKLKPNIKE
jgi:hypothetical protein